MDDRVKIENIAKTQREDGKIHVAFMSDLDSRGSGYRNLSVILCDGLVEQGIEVKVIGLHYFGDEHQGKYSLIPTETIQDDALLVLGNLVQLWGVDVLIVALDIPLQGRFMQMIGSERPFKYVGIMPIESDPLCTTWAMTLMMMDKALIISRFGLEEAKLAGVVNADYLEIGIDTDFWKPISEQEKIQAKSAMGLTDTFTVLTVADNHERKNLWAGMFAFSELVKAHPNENLKYVIVTREFNQYGWCLQDLAIQYGISNHIMIVERGVPPEQLRSLYACADVFMLTSKAEGLGLPLLEAMAMKIPCVATDCTGMKELLENGRGILVPPDYTIVDPFGNGRRYWVDIKCLHELLEYLYANPKQTKMVNKARKFVEKRSWSIGKETLCKVIQEIVNGKGQEEIPSSETTTV